MKPNLTPSVLLIIIIAALPVLSETLYTPTLPDIAKSLMVSGTLVEYTLGIYLLGFAVGSLFFGKISDKHGRKPTLLAGFAFYVIGCLFCALSHNIEMLLASRFLQAFGCSVGSVLGQSISRDAFSGSARGKLFATVGMAIAFTPAIGPFLGGLIDQAFGWQAVFLLLSVLGIVVWITAYLRLPETHPKHIRTHNSMLTVLLKMLKDRKVLAYAFLIAGANGLTFSYYAEGSFYMIDLLKVSPSYYGLSFVILATSGFLGGLMARKLHDSMQGSDITRLGILATLLGSSVFSAITIILLYLDAASSLHITITIACMAIITFGIGITIPSTLSEALQDYHYAIGTASALFGFIYYVGISLITFGMGTVHNGSLLTMPIYFLVVSLCMFVVLRKAISA